MSPGQKTLISIAVCLGVVSAGTAVIAQNSPLPLGPNEDRQAEVASLTATLGSDAPVFEKVLACKRLAVIGDESAVPALAAALADKDLAHLARYALEPIPHPSVDAALRGALRELEGELKIGVINSIGQRKDAAAVDALAELLADPHPAVAAASAAALGRLGTPRTAEILRQALGTSDSQFRGDVADAALACADELLEAGGRDGALALYDLVRQSDVKTRYVIAATWSGIIARENDGLPLLIEQLNSQEKPRFEIALQAARRLHGTEVTEALLAQLEKQPPQRQALLISALGDRGDTAALPAVRRAMQSKSRDVRIAAVHALPSMADASVVADLIKMANDADADIAQTARDSLATLRGANLDEAILDQLDTSNAEQQGVVIEIVGERRIQAAIPTLLKLADNADRTIRKAAIGALGETIGPAQLSVLTDRLIRARSQDEQAAVQEALLAAAIRLPSRQTVDRLADMLPEIPPRHQVNLLDVIGRVGGERALEIVTAHATGDDELLQDAATRLLGEWLDPTAAEPLLELTHTLESEKYRIRAMRGYIRIVRQFDLPNNERIKMCRTALETAWRDAEKQLVLDALSRVPSPAALTMIVDQLENPSLKARAQQTALTAGQRLLRNRPQAVAKAMQAVLDSGATGNTARTARTLLRRAKDAASS